MGTSDASGLHRAELEEEFMRALVFPEEDRHLFTKSPWRGGYRWFRSPNVIPIERWRRYKQAPKRDRE
jgi:hypothetical protein